MSRLLTSLSYRSTSSLFFFYCEGRRRNSSCSLWHSASFNSSWTWAFLTPPLYCGPVFFSMFLIFTLSSLSSTVCIIFLALELSHGVLGAKVVFWCSYLFSCISIGPSCAWRRLPLKICQLLWALSPSQSPPTASNLAKDLWWMLFFMTLVLGFFSVVFFLIQKFISVGEKKYEEGVSEKSKHIWLLNSKQNVP